MSLYQKFIPMKSAKNRYQQYKPSFESIFFLALLIDTEHINQSEKSEREKITTTLYGGPAPTEAAIIFRYLLSL